MRNYAYGVVMSLGLVVTALLWYERPGAFILGQDIAEIVSGAWERYEVPRTYGTNAPARWYTEFTVTTAALTNYTAEISIQKVSGDSRFSGGFVNGFDTAPLLSTAIFQSTNALPWQKNLYFSRTSPLDTNGLPISAVFEVSGANRAARMFYITAWPPGATPSSYNDGEDGAIYSGVNVIYIPYGTDGTFSYAGVSGIPVPGDAAIPYDFTTITNSTGPGVVRPHRDLGQLQYALNRLRSCITNTFYVLPSSEVLGDGGQLVWLDASAPWPGHGDYLTRCDEYLDWVEYDLGIPGLEPPAIYSYALSQPSEIKEVIKCTGSRYQGSAAYPVGDPDAAMVGLPGKARMTTPAWTDPEATDALLDYEYTGGNWWTHSGLGTNAYMFSGETVSPSNTFRLFSSVRSNTLFSVLSAGTNLSRSVLFLGGAIQPNVIAYDSAYEYRVSFGTYTNSGGVSGNDAPYYDKSAMIQNMGAGPTGSNTFPIVSFILPYFSVSAEGEASREHVVPAGEDDDYSSYVEQSSLEVRWTDHKGVLVKYPSLFAVTNGYVAKVSVFGVTSRNYHNTVGWSTIYELDSFSQTGSGFAWSSEASMVYDWPVAAPLFAADPPLSTATSAHWVWFDHSGSRCFGLRLVHLHTAVNPTTEDDLKFDITPDLAIPAPEDLEFSEAWGEHTSYPTGATVSRRYDWLITQVSSDFLFFVIVVDWNWKHLNPDRTETPPIYNPPWVNTSP